VIDSTNQIILVTPVWNDSTRLAKYGKTLASAFAESALPIRWVIADDGSISEEHTKLKELKTEFSKTFANIDLHFASDHWGKGSVIREAWELYPDAKWLAFVDADGSVTAPDLLKLIHQACDNNQSILGIRKRTEKTQITESFYRSIFHHGFLLSTHLILDLQCEDPQCGAKVLKGEDYRSICHLLEENGLAFDSELLTALKHNSFDWIEQPVNWTEKKGGKVKPLKEAWGMFRALLRIRDRIL